ncbi:MAG: phospholipase [Bacteroides sp.]
MWVLIVSLLCLAIVALLAGYVRNRRLQQKIDRGELSDFPEVNDVDGECCGQHEVCERDSLLAAVSQRIEYYDDEELDRFIGRAPDGYTDAEADLFRDVFYTMRDVDVAGWVRSLQLRGIGLPDGIKDEVLLVVTERRIHL